MHIDRTFQNLLDYWASIKPDEIVCFDEFANITYKEMAEECNALAISLAERGIGKGDKVLTLMRNSYESIIIFFAVAKIGAVLVPCNSTFGKFEIEKRCQVLSPDVVFISEAKWLTIINKEINALVITVRFSRKGNEIFNNLITSKSPYKFKCADMDSFNDIFAIVYTSGSTCEGKGVMLTYDSMLHSAVNIGEKLECTNNDVFFVPLPASHMFCILMGILTPLYYGCKIILAYGFDASRALDLMEEYKVTVSIGVPTMFIRELHEQLERKRDMSCLKKSVIAGAGYPAKLVHDVEKGLYCKVLVAYGSTEALAISMTCLDDKPEQRSLTVGRVFDTVDIKLIGDDGKEVINQKIGEIVCKGRSVMKGYLTEDDGFDTDGWLHTGDIGEIDKDGFLKIVGRKKDIIIRGGYNVSPAEIESAFIDYPDVLEVCVLGESNEDLGERICLFAKLKDKSNITVDSLKEYICTKVARYKRPDCVVILDEIPKLENGKYDCRLLRKMLKKNI